MKCGTCGAPLKEHLGKSICLQCSFVAALNLTEAAPSGSADVAGYELLYELGRGAMGVVWLARERRLDRLVALKLIPTGSNPLFSQRLLREGQIAARLRHPHIVTVHALGGAGSSTYLAMDFLEGGNLDTRLQGKPLPSRVAAEITEKLAGALAHAHAAGLLHRDLKPSNILLDLKGEPHLADFGLAAPLEGAGDLTATGQIQGTPAYLAPELLGGFDRASARSDLYGLGALLYACLTGRAPFIGNSTASILAQVANSEPLPPRLFHPGLPLDLETICLKCLERSPFHRYPSAEALQGDLQRFLNGEPITARPITALGKAIRWCRRKPAGAAAIGLAAAILFILGVGGPVVALRLDRARRVAEAAHAQAAIEVVTTKEIIDFLQNDLLAQASPDNQPDRDLKLRTVVDRAAKRIDGRFGDRPLVEASLRETLGKTYDSLGDYVSAQRFFEHTLEIRKQQIGSEAPDSLSSRADLSRVLAEQGKYKEAELLGSETLRARQRIIGPNHPDTVSSMIELEETLQHLGKIAEAEKLVQEALAIAQRTLGPDHLSTLTAMNDLAFIYRGKRNLAEAESLNLRVLTTYKRVLGAENHNTLSSMINLAAVYRSEGKFAEAEAVFSEAYEISKRVQGPEHPNTLFPMNNLAVVYQDQGKFAEAGALLAQILEISQRVIGRDHPNTLRSMSNLAIVYQAKGDYVQAEKLSSEMLELSKRVLSPEHPITLIAMNNLASTYRLQGKLPEAESLCMQTVEISTRTLGLNHPDTCRFTHNLASVDLAEAKLSDAEALHRRNLETRTRVLGPANPETLQTLESLGEVLILAGKFDEAETTLRKALEGRIALAPKHWLTFATRELLGEALLGLKRFPEAEPLLLESYEQLRSRAEFMPLNNRPIVQKARGRLAELYAEWGSPAKAAEWKQRWKKESGVRREWH